MYEEMFVEIELDIHLDPLRYIYICAPVIIIIKIIITETSKCPEENLL
jgi:hypothetical protein